MSTLLRAARRGDFELVRELVGADGDLYAEDSDGITSLHVAAESGQTAVIRELLRLGAVADVRSRDGVRPLHLACRGNHGEAAALLLEDGACPSTSDDSGFTPLHAAADGSAARIAARLIRAGAPPNARAHGGGTPLHTAAETGHAGVARILLAGGADANARRDDGSVPLHYAARGGYASVIRVLLRHGADMDAEDDLGQTPRDCATRAAVTLLRDAGAKSGAGRTGTPAVTPAPHLRLEGTTLAVGAHVPGTGYRLSVRLGRDGASELWAAESADGLVALRFCVDPASVGPFRTRVRELVAAARACADPEALAAPIDSGLERGRDLPFVGLAPTSGEPLDAYLTRRFAADGPLPPDQAADLLRPLTDLVARLHGLPPVPERPDLRPSNIFVAATAPYRFQIDGFGTRVTSFVAAAQAGSAERPASLADAVAYASHEQSLPGRGRAPSDDVHALGILWCSLLFGESAPFGLSPPGQVRFFDWAAFRGRLAECGLRPEAAALLESCLKPEGTRPKDAKDVATALRALYPTLRERAEFDAGEIASARRSGADWQSLLGSKLRTRRSLWERAAGVGSTAAQWLLGLEAEHGARTSEELASAVPHFAAAADQGSATANYDLAIYRLHGLGGETRDPGGAVRLLRQAAERGHRRAQLELGICLRDGVGAPGDPAGAARWLRSAAGAGITEAYYELGRLLRDAAGNCLPAFETAKDLLTRAGHVYPEQRIAALRRLGRELITRAAETGHVAACYELGRELLANLRDADDLKRAEGLWFRAASAGHRDSQREVGKLRLRRWREHGAVRTDAESAIRLLRSAAELGDPEAAYHLGAAYFAEQRPFVEEPLPGVDEREAVARLDAALEAGHAGAARVLDRHVPEPPPESLPRLIRAALRGVRQAQERLARYRETLGDSDLRLHDGSPVVETDRLYRVAAAAGEPAASRCLLRWARSRGGRSSRHEARESDETPTSASRSPIEI